MLNIEFAHDKLPLDKKRTLLVTETAVPIEDVINGVK
jgi:hypothetical protein